MHLNHGIYKKVHSWSESCPELCGKANITDYNYRYLLVAKNKCMLAKYSYAYQYPNCRKQNVLGLISYRNL